MASLIRGLAQALLPGLPSRFPNVNQAVRFLRRTGYSYHRQTMWRDVATFFQSAAKAPLQQTFAPYERLSQDLFIEKDWRRPETYYYYGNLYLRDKATGELYFTSYSLYADSGLSDDELSEIVYAIEDEKETSTDPTGDVVSFESLRSYHKWGSPRSSGYQIAEI